MKRKIIKQADSYTITLPKGWVENKGLKRGDEIDLIETPTDLMIRSDVVKKREITIELTEEHKKDFRPILTHIYRRGFSVIRLKGVDKEIMSQTRSIVNDLLLGFEITEIKDDECTLENISEPTGERYDAIIRRVFLIMKEIHSLLEQDFRLNKLDNLDEIIKMTRQQDKLIFFCRRVLIKEKLSREITLDWELLTILMYIGHEYWYLYKYASEKKVKKTKELLELLKDTQEYFDLLYHAYFEKDIKYVLRMNIMKKKLVFEKCFRLLENSKGNMTVVYGYLREILRFIQIGSSPVLSEVIDLQEKEKITE